MRVCYLFIFAFILQGCFSETEDQVSGLEFFPSTKYMSEGVVSKYYFHHKRKNATRKTDILYHKIKMHDKGKIRLESYNAAFQKISSLYLEDNNSKWEIIKDTSFNYRNIYKEEVKINTYDYSDNTFIHWSGRTSVNTRTYDDSLYTQKITTTFDRSIDTTVNGNAQKIFMGSRLIDLTIKETDETRTTEYNLEKKYEEGLGMIYQKVENDDFSYLLELDEVMSLKEFKTRSNHSIHRVAYIDSKSILDPDTTFKTCYPTSKINDYYNDDKAGILGGKGRLRAILEEKLDSKKIQGESGYLTYRFVINCQGEAGRFVTEEAGLDYERKSFSKNCKDHLFKILRSIPKWKILKINGEPRDSYFYVTFKLNNGEIIEILP